ncbi:peptidylprolyl isomerase [Thiolapillus sp.]|uniref:peptidylprolyl isomerase n=2 Tax=Thiolapillus sp. TaxID=2017437 RepID=UPI0025F7CF87|nr:peptidylprolyl isomerase [Thiolapillus sp.]
MLKKWLREPLVHFLLIGGLLFLLYGLKNDGMSDVPDRIVITRASIDHLSDLWERKRQRPPTDEEMQVLIEAQIREEVLYREALAMGLDRKDSVMRRRLAQKMAFITSDLVAQAEPGEEQLAAYLVAHADRFSQPGHISFEQIYLNADRRGGQAQDDARRMLALLNTPDSPDDAAVMGDRFMLGQSFENVTLQQVAQLFGKGFAEELFVLPVDGWQGPISSGYGLHLVRIHGKSSPAPLQLEAIRDRVRDAWREEQRQAINESFYQGLRQRYEIVVEGRTPGTSR